MNPLVKVKVATGILGVLGVAACSEPAAIGTWNGGVDSIGGVTVVTNPAEPLHSEGAGVRLERVWTQGGPSEGEGVWQEPKAIAAGDGSLFILDGIANRVYRLDAATGRQMAAFGQRGAGPGELQMAVDIEVSSGKITVLDARVLDQFSPAGRYLSSIQPDAVIFSLNGFGDGRLLATAFGSDSRLLVVEGDSLFPVPVPEPVTEVETGFDSCQRFGTASQGAVRLSCIRPYFQLFAANGTPFLEAEVDYEPQPRSDAELKRYLGELSGGLIEAGAPAAQVDAIVATQRAQQRMRRRFRTVMQDPATGILALWEQEDEDFGGGPATLHLFDAEARYMAAVPARTAWWDFAFVDGDIVALSRNGDSGLVEAVRYRLVGLSD